MNPKIRITFVMPCDDLSGGNRVVAMYAKHLMARGHQVLVVNAARHHPTLMDRLRMLRKMDSAAWAIAVKYPPGHIELSGVPQRVLKQQGALTDADVPDADVIIATWWETVEYVARLSPAKGAKVYFIQHYEVFDYLPVARVKETWKLPFHKIAIAQWLADVAAKEFGDHDVSVVPNSVDLQHFQTASRGKQKTPTIGFVYSLIPWKGVDIALEAIKLAQQQVPALQVLAFGAWKVSENYPLPEQCQYVMTPDQSTIRDIYASCDAWLFASHSEGCGLPILEAMACRTPVIGVPSGVAPEYLADQCGILVKPEDPQDMSAAIVSVCNMSDSDWRSMSASAYKKVSAYDWDDATTLFENALCHAIYKKNEV